MLVFVLNRAGKPLMPCSPAKAGFLLRRGKAEVVKRTPFVIRLKYGSGGYRQPVTAGLDSGYLNVGVSVVAGGKELHAEEVVLRSDIVVLNSERRQHRRNRRNRKTWYRQPRFLNRKKPEGWLAPSLQHKLDSQVKLVVGLAKVVPVTKVVVEVASFDIQKIKNPEIAGVGYQQGEQAGFANVREYVLYRDGHRCRCCNGRSKDERLEVHHRESRKTGGNRPENLVTLCETCHDRATAGEDLGFGKTPLGFKAETFMTTVRWKLMARLREWGFEVAHTFGYITKMRREEARIEKTHANDAFVIAGGTGEYERQRVILLKMQVRKCNRKLFKGDRSHLRNTAPRLVKGFARFDKVRYRGIECFVSGRRSTGYFDLRKLDGTRVHASAKWADLRLLERGGTMPSGYKQARRGAAHSSPGASPGVSCAML